MNANLNVSKINSNVLLVGTPSNNLNMARINPKNEKIA
jgi:hypothetical protein